MARPSGLSMAIGSTSAPAGSGRLQVAQLAVDAYGHHGLVVAVEVQPGGVGVGQLFGADTVGADGDRHRGHSSAHFRCRTGANAPRVRLDLGPRRTALLPSRRTPAKRQPGPRRVQRTPLERSADQATHGIWWASPASDRGDWRSGSALRSHRRGHWFEPSIAHPESPSQEHIDPDRSWRCQNVQQQSTAVRLTWLVNPVSPSSFAAAARVAIGQILSEIHQRLRRPNPSLPSPSRSQQS